MAATSRALFVGKLKPNISDVIPFSGEVDIYPLSYISSFGTYRIQGQVLCRYGCQEAATNWTDFGLGVPGRSINDWYISVGFLVSCAKDVLHVRGRITTAGALHESRGCLLTWPTLLVVESKSERSHRTLT